jgi:hypothetical protein
LHWRAALDLDPIDIVHSAEVKGTRGEVDPLAVGRPGVKLIIVIIKSQPFEIARLDPQNVNVTVAGAR